MKTIKRRRKENRTDYTKRLKQVKSGMPRIVFRKTNRFIISQYVQSKKAQDKVDLTLNSKSLELFGWPKEFSGSLKSIPAAYLLGLLTGKKIPESEFIIDFGMQRMIHKNTNYAFIKGLIDSGKKIKCKKETFPEENRILGKNLKKDFSKHFDAIKNNILKETAEKKLKNKVKN